VQAPSFRVAAATRVAAGAAALGGSSTAWTAGASYRCWNDSLDSGAMRTAASMLRDALLHARMMKPWLAICTLLLEM
jgi:hypothetical protein